MKKLILTSLAISLSSSAMINAAVSLTWTDSAYTNSSQISNAGTQLVSFNFGTSSSVVVNGETFTGYSGGGAFTGTNFQPGGGTIIGDFNTDYTGNNVTGMTTTDEGNLLNTANYATGGINTKMTGLTSGVTYEVQLLLVDNRSGFTTRNMHISEDGTTWASLLVDYTSNGATPYARLVETTFTANDTEQAFRWGIQNIGDYEGAAMQIRTVPEPSSAALLGLGGLALILRRKK